MYVKNYIIACFTKLILVPTTVLFRIYQSTTTKTTYTTKPKGTGMPNSNKKGKLKLIDKRF